MEGDSFFLYPGDSVGLSDVSAPEWDELGGDRAKEALVDLLFGRTIYLETDQKYGRDRYGRLIAVVYVKHDTTSYINVNKALLNQGVIYEDDYTNNEFDPSRWRLIVSGLDNRNRTKFLGISAVFGFIVCLFFHYGRRESARACLY
jgi:endonuclease YncB( thermonuclease family)